MGRICKDFGRITSDSVDPGWGVNQQSTWEGSTDFGRIISDNVDPGGSLTVNLGRICEDCGRITSDSVDPGGGLIDSQLGRDL